MKKLSVNFLFPLIAMVILIYALSHQLFGVSPVGKLFNPFQGAVQNGSDGALNASRLSIPGAGLKDSVTIYFDDRKVPHIYAGNEEDLHFAQGYVTASLRLWQMDFMSYASGGRLSEIFADGFVGYDRLQRRIGVMDAAKASLEFMEKDSVTKRVLNAYTRGVNTYIRQLDYKSMPFEYKMLDYHPEEWTNLKTVLIMKQMANTLSGYEDDYSVSNMMLALGEQDFNLLFPEYGSHISPIAGYGGKGGNTELVYEKKPDYLNYSFLSMGTATSPSTYNPRLGSNSWAVSGKKSASGYPILCSDPHLNLALPSIWVEMQLSSPEENVYGVAIPGVPAIIIGFNNDIAWGETNGADDVKDWYKLNVTPDYKKYEMDGKWLDLSRSIEKIKRRGQAVFYDTVYRTMQGPLVFDRSYNRRHPELINHALRWELHSPSNEILTFIKLNRAKNYAEFREAIGHYACPIQNFTFADKNNDIAIVHQGKMAEKWAGQGKYILDGTRSDHLYSRYIPEDSLPQVLNPACQYVYSANQHPTDSGYKYYYNGYFSENRASRIKQLLDVSGKVDYKFMEKMQLDNTNVFAVNALPVLKGRIGLSGLTANERKDFDWLMQWDGAYDLTDEHARLFELWWKNIKDNTWDELTRFPFYSRAPKDYVLLDLIANDPRNKYFDKQGTTIKETAWDIVTAGFKAAAGEYEQIKRTGSVKWGDSNRVSIMHMTNLGALSATKLSSAGYPEAINAISSGWGPSWRMIVELGPRPKAYGIYPGGQSGNVGSRFYENGVDDWRQGKYYRLNFFADKSDADKETTHVWVLK